MTSIIVRNALEESMFGLTSLLDNAVTVDKIARAGTVISHAFSSGRKVLCCGNGGSMCDAMHFAEECLGRFRNNRPPLPAIALSDAGFLSCVANDFGWEQVFSRGILALGEPGDIALLISTSGSSRNIIEAQVAAKQKQLTVISLTGKINSIIGKDADIDICTPVGMFSDRIQELHIKVLHILVEICERNLFPDLYN